jgi:hypothetical protein
MTTAAREASPASATLAVVLRREEGGPELTREAVSDADLLDAQGELWLAGCLRKGRPAVALDDLPLRVLPLPGRGRGPRCLGFALEADGPAGGPARLEFGVHALAHVASRAARRLLEVGALETGDTYYYEIHADARPPLRAAAPAGPAGMKLSARPAPPAFEAVELPPLLERARAVGEADERCYPVLYTEQALARAERLARKGADVQPPIETGAVLIGPLCSCPRTGEFFAVVCEALGVTDAEEREFSLTYSGKSWARIQAVMKARQARPATRAHRILGQCHGHNFLPAGGAAPCEECAAAKVCSRTSVFVSPDDRLWSRAVFSRQPWQLCHIFGLSARGDTVGSLFGLRDGQLLERGYHVVPDFPGRT